MSDQLTVEPQRVEDVLAFVLSATSEEIVERLFRTERRLVELNARLRAVRDLIDEAGL